LRRRQRTAATVAMRCRIEFLRRCHHQQQERAVRRRPAQRQRAERVPARNLQAAFLRRRHHRRCRRRSTRHVIRPTVGVQRGVHGPPCGNGDRSRRGVRRGANNSTYRHPTLPSQLRPAVLRRRRDRQRETATIASEQYRRVHDRVFRKRCGDASWKPAVEECDDGSSNSNTTPDACRTTCETPAAATPSSIPGEQCDDGHQNRDGRLHERLRRQQSAATGSCSPVWKNAMKVAPTRIRRECVPTSCGGADCGETSSTLARSATVQCASDVERRDLQRFGSCARPRTSAGLGELTLKAGYGVSCTRTTTVPSASVIRSRIRKTATALDNRDRYLARRRRQRRSGASRNIECASGTAPSACAR